MTEEKRASLNLELESIKLEKEKQEKLLVEAQAKYDDAKKQLDFIDQGLSDDAKSLEILEKKTQIIYRKRTRFRQGNRTVRE